MAMQRVIIAATTAADGSFTGYSQHPVNGHVEHMRYTPGASPIDTNGDIDVTGESSGVVVADHDNIGLTAFTKAYRSATHDINGVAATYDGTRPVLNKVAIAGERLKLVIANGGNATSGTFEFVVNTDD